MKDTDIECTTIECILSWVMRNWAGCKKFGVVGYTSSDIDLVCTTTGYTRLISQLLGASSDMDLVYTATGYASNDTDLGSKPLGTQSLLPWVQGSWVCQYLKQLLVTLTKENINDVNLGYITIGKTEFSALTGCRRVACAISVHTQTLGMLAYIDFVYTTAGYTNNAIDVGCTTIGNKGFTALIAGELGMPLVYIHSCWVC